MAPGDRVAVPADSGWAPGSVLGFDSWDNHDALVLLLPVSDEPATVKVPPAACWRLGSRADFSG